MSDESAGDEGMDLRRPLMEGQPAATASRRSTSSGETDNELELMASDSHSQNGSDGPRLTHPAHSFPLAKPKPNGVQSPDTESSTGGGSDSGGTVETKKKKKERVTWGGVSEAGRQRKRPTPRNVTGRPTRLEVVDETERFDVHPSDYSLFDEGYFRHPRHHTRSRHDTGCLSPPEATVITRGDTVTTRGSSLTDSFSEDGRVIDGRYSISAQDVPSDFVRIELPIGSGDASTTQNLETCKKTVLDPYMYFLKFIGWRRIRANRHDIEVPKVVIIGNFIYPAVICILLLYACGSQVVSCFERTMPTNAKPSTNQTLDISCKDNLVTSLIIQDILLIAAYLYGLYIVRYAETEHLARLIETVFLSYTGMQVQHSQKRLIWTLRVFLMGGLIWVLFSLGISTMRLFSLRLLDKDTRIEFLTDKDDSSFSTTEDVFRYVFVFSSLIGFIFFDLLYVAVVINYASQCQLLIFYTYSIIVKVQTKAYRLGDAIKEISQTYDFLGVLNGKLATLTSLCLFIFVSSLVSSVYELSQVDRDDLDQTSLYLGVCVGVCNIVQWAFLSMVPIVQAARLTASCSRLRRLGLDIASRPYIYSDTSQLVLDSFLQFTDATRYRAKLVSVPIYPFCVVGGLFVFGVVAVCVVFAFPIFTFAPWF